MRNLNLCKGPGSICSAEQRPPSEITARHPCLSHRSSIAAGVYPVGVSQSTPGPKSVFNNHSIPRVLQRLEAGLSDFSVYSVRRRGCRRRMPGPPPFSSMNSMPAFSRAPLTSSRVRGYGALAPRSKSAMVLVAVLLAFERSACDQPRRPRAPRHCPGLIDIINVTLHYIS
jgi:hypothetical protein